MEVGCEIIENRIVNWSVDWSRRSKIIHKEANTCTYLTLLRYGRRPESKCNCFWHSLIMTYTEQLESTFLACKSCPSVRPSVRPSLHPSIHPSIHQSVLFLGKSHRIILGEEGGEEGTTLYL